jgi:hypothetical protein
MTESVDLGALRIDDFTPHIDATFDMQATGGVVPLKLAKVDPAGDSGRAGGAFSLIFVTPKGPWLPQGVYPVPHPVLGIMEIFLVPVGPASGGNGYQAVFT